MRNKEIAFAHAYAWIKYGEDRLVSAFVRGYAFGMGREAARKRRRLVGDRWITINGTHVQTKGDRLMGRAGIREALGDESYRAVQEVLTGAAPCIKSVWDAIESKLKVAETNLSVLDSAYTDPDGCIHFNAEKTARGDLFNDPYTTLFHEGAHAIDRLLTPEGRGHFSDAYNNGELARTAIREVRKSRRNYESRVGTALKAGAEALS